MGSAGTVLNVLRLGRLIRTRGSSSCFVEFLDRAEGETKEPIDVPQQMVALGAGVYVQPPDGALVLVGKGYMNRLYVVSYVGSDSFLSKVGNGPASTSTLSTDSFRNPSLKQGEVLIRGLSSSGTKYAESGDIVNFFGTGSNITLSSSNSFGIYADNSYGSYSSGYFVSGVINRESKPQQFKTGTDRLSAPSFDGGLVPVGRNPKLGTSLITQEKGKSRRNPPLVEQRNVVYEFSRESAANSPAVEKKLYNEATSTLGIKDIKNQRQGSRTDAFGLSPLQYNILCETIIGTAVDINSNILDLNRNPIPTSVFNRDSEPVRGQYEALRRSIKMHIELNSRKESESPGSFTADSSSAPFAGGLPIGADHSRWSIDVDGEGQTKINIPASSSTGNIPVHSRYLSSSYFVESVLTSENLEVDKTAYMTQNNLSAYNSANFTSDSGQRRDTVHVNYALTADNRGLPLGEGAAPESINKKRFRWTMPYHDPGFSDILSKDVKLGIEPSWYTGGKNPFTKYSQIFGGDVLSGAALTNTKDSPISGSVPNAGGRSLFLNADGSMEIAVGMDQIDGKSVVLDSAGSLIGRFGRDKQNNSIMLAADGSATVVMGASGRSGDSGTSRGADLKIIVASADNSSVATVEIIDGHIRIRSAVDKNIILEASKNLILSAGKQVLIHSEKIGVFGEYTEMGETVVRKRVVSNNGEEI